jgi:hypothetical protein
LTNEERNVMAAAISLRGMHFRGALVVIARPSFFRSTYPVAVHFELRGSESPLVGPQGTPAPAEGSAVLF